MKSKLDLNNFIVVDNFLEEDKFRDIQELELTHDEKKDEYKVNYLSQKDVWRDGLFSGDGVEATNMHVQDETYFYGIHNEEPIIHLQNKIVSFLQNNLKQNLYLKSPTKKFYSASKFYSWENSNIFWHNDGGWDYGITYYIHNEWEDNWGGELLLENNQWISPKPNRIVFIKAPFKHKTCIVAEGAGERLTIQTFVQKDFNPEKMLSDEQLDAFKKLPESDKHLPTLFSSKELFESLKDREYYRELFKDIE